jgi:hypothetical protein
VDLPPNDGPQRIRHSRSKTTQHKMPHATDPTDPIITFSTPGGTWEETCHHLLQLGVTREELPSWHSLWRLQRWHSLKGALEQGWDPHESISTCLDDFCLSLGNRIFRCLAPEKDGGVCGRDGQRKDRTISHVCNHLGYNPYVCGGICGDANW